MSLSDYTKRALITVSVNADQAEKELKDLTKATDATSKAFDNVGTKAAKAEQSIDKVGKTADKQASGFTKFSNSLGLDKVSQFTQALGPWNQALEFGGKAIRLAEAGLDAYGKTSKEAAAQVKALTDEVNGYKTSALQAVGEVTVGVLGAIPPINQMKQAWVNAQVQTEDFFDMLERRSNQDAWKDAFDAFFGEFERVQTKAGTDEDALLKQQRSIATAAGLPDAIKLTLTNLKGAVEWSGVGEKLDGLADGFTNAADAAKKSREEMARWRAEFRAAQAGDHGRNNVTTPEPTPYSPKSITPPSDAEMKSMNAAFEGMYTQKQKLLMQGYLPGEGPGTALNGESGQSFLARALGPLNEFDAYATAFQGLGDVAGSAFEAIATGSGSIGAVIRDGAKQTLLSLGKEEAVQAIKELAWGFSQLASGPLGAAVAPLHFKSAALHGAAAAAAGVAVHALGSIGGGGGGGGAPGGAGAYGGGSFNGGGGTSTQTKTTTQTIYIVQGDSFSEDSPRMRQRKAERVVALGTARASSVTGDF